MRLYRLNYHDQSKRVRHVCSFPSGVNADLAKDIIERGFVAEPYVGCHVEVVPCPGTMFVEPVDFLILWREFVRCETRLGSVNDWRRRLQIEFNGKVTIRRNKVREYIIKFHGTKKGEPNVWTLSYLEDDIYEAAQTARAVFSGLTLEF